MQTRLGAAAEVFTGRRRSWLDRREGSYALPALSLRDLGGWRVSIADADRITVEHPGQSTPLPGRGRRCARRRAWHSQFKAAIVPTTLAKWLSPRASLASARTLVFCCPRCCLLSSDHGRASLELSRAGSVGHRRSLTRADVERIEVPVPPREAQEKIAVIIRRVERLRGVRRAGDTATARCR